MFHSGLPLATSTNGDYENLDNWNSSVALSTQYPADFSSDESETGLYEMLYDDAILNASAQNYDQLERHALYSSADVYTCDKHITLDVMQSRTIITTPNYPEPYPANVRCDIIVNAPSDDFYLELMFTDLHFQQESETCEADYLIISTWNENLASASNSSRICGNWNSKIKLLRRIDSNIGLYIITDAIGNYKGFRAEVRLVKRKKGAVPSSSRIASEVDMYGSKEDDEEEEEGEAIALCDNQWFTLFNNNCYLISVYPEVSWFTAHRICEDIESRLLLIKNATDESTLAGLLQVTTYMANTDLSHSARLFWVQSNSMGDTYYQGPTDDHEANWLREWFSDNEPANGRVVDSRDSYSTQVPVSTANAMSSSEPTLTSVTQEATCLAVSPTRQSSGDEKILYRRVSCKESAGYVCVKKPLDLSDSRNRTIKNMEKGHLSSSNYPNSYPNNLHYEVEILTSPQSVIVVWFDMLDIEYQEDCLYDYLTLREDETKLDTGRQCGKYSSDAVASHLRNYTYFSKSNQVRVAFHSDYSNRGKGFALNWKTVYLNWCTESTEQSTLISNSSKNNSLESPGYPEWILPSLNCTINIKAPEGQRVLLTLLDFDLGYAQKSARGDKCNTEAAILQVSLGLGKNVNLCGSIDLQDYHGGQHFMSYQSNLSMRLITQPSNFGSPYKVQRGFKFKYDYIPLEGTLTTLLKLVPGTYGTIGNLNYPHGAPLHVENIIYLKTAIGHSIELRASKLLHSYLTEGECLTGQEALLSVTDHYGNISFFPPSPTSWSVCRKLQDFKSDRVRKSVRGHYASFMNRLKPIQSTFHSLAIRSSAVDDIEAVRYFLPAFQFYYKTAKDETFLNKTVPLPARYPVDSCSYNPCSENGLCRQRRQLHSKNNDTSNQCVCKNHWTGIFCHMTLCEKRPCGDRGLCKLDSKKNSHDYICHCNAGYTGKNCQDTLDKCDRHNPCRDRGKCSLVNGIPTCSCQPWYEGKFCEKFRYKMQYRPLSQRMLEEPFWLGLIAVLSVLAVISLVYCIKNMFSERIEKFFAEEIERSKAMSYNFVEPNSAPRYSLTSNIGFSINLTANNSPLPRSRSSIIGKLGKGRLSRGRGGGHMSDSEVFQSREGRAEEKDSDAESSSFDKGKIFARLIGRRSFRKDDRRMSLDDFNKMTDKRGYHKKRFLDIDCSEYDKRSLASTLSETSFMIPSSPVDRTIPTIAEFHVITENSMEDQDSVQSGNRSPLRTHHLDCGIPADSISLSDKLPHFLKQESEAESLLQSIRKIQRVSNTEMSSYSEEEEMQRRSLLGNRCSSPRPRLSRPPSGFSSSSSESQLLCAIPEITVTAAIERSDKSPFEVPELISGDYDDTGSRKDSYESNIEVDVHHVSINCIPPHLRRSSVPTPLSDDGNNRYCSASSMSCDTPINRVLAGQVARKHSLELSVPMITITEGYDSTRRPSEATIRGMNAIRNDRTISESNLSTSGYSSLSSPGISRCSSSSPIHEEVHIVIPPTGNGTEIVMQASNMPTKAHVTKQKSTYGNFLTIPSFNFPMIPHHSPASSPKISKSGMQTIKEKQVFSFSSTSNSPSISRRASQESRDEGIEMGDMSNLRGPSSPTIHSKRGRLVTMRQQHVTVDPGHDSAESRRCDFKGIQSSKSFDGFFYGGQREGAVSEGVQHRQHSKAHARDSHPRMVRQPSCPGLLHPPEVSPSSDSEVDTVQEKARERQIMLLKRFERRKHGSNSSLNSSERRNQFRTRSRSPLAFSQSIDIASGGSHTKHAVHYQRCSSARSLCAAIYMDDGSVTSSSSDSIPSSLNEDEPITIRSARSLNTIHMSTSSFNSNASSANVNVMENEVERKRTKISLKDKILLKMRTQSHSLPASPQMPEAEVEALPATASASLVLLTSDSDARRSRTCSRSNSVLEEISESSATSDTKKLIKSKYRPFLVKQKASLDFS
ncbi:Protocadherin Fat 3 [Halotydeus destructor]|nr:Protocadherin Fat 3 [Halotydeus destructor]